MVTSRSRASDNQQEARVVGKMLKKYSPLQANADPMNSNVHITADQAPHFQELLRITYK